MTEKRRQRLIDKTRRVLGECAKICCNAGLVNAAKELSDLRDEWGSGQPRLRVDGRFVSANEVERITAMRHFSDLLK